MLVQDIEITEIILWRNVSKYLKARLKCLFEAWVFWKKKTTTKKPTTYSKSPRNNSIEISWIFTKLIFKFKSCSFDLCLGQRIWPSLNYHCLIPPVFRKVSAYEETEYLCNKSYSFPCCYRIASLGAFVRQNFGYAGYARDLGINHVIPVNAILWSRSPINRLRLHQSRHSNFTQVERSLMIFLFNLDSSERTSGWPNTSNNFNFLHLWRIAFIRRVQIAQIISLFVTWNVKWYNSSRSD